MIFENLLDDDSIRRILNANKQLIISKERVYSNNNTICRFNKYLANKLSVHKQHSNKQYISIKELERFLGYCSYKLNYYIEPID